MTNLEENFIQIENENLNSVKINDTDNKIAKNEVKIFIKKENFKKTTIYTKPYKRAKFLRPKHKQFHRNLINILRM